jgi:hypothetical protein
MEVSGQLHAPAALPPWKEHPVPIRYEAGWGLESVWTLWRREKYFCRESNPARSSRNSSVYRLSYPNFLIRG